MPSWELWNQPKNIRILLLNKNEFIFSKDLPLCDLLEQTGGSIIAVSRSENWYYHEIIQLQDWAIGGKAPNSNKLWKNYKMGFTLNFHVTDGPVYVCDTPSPVKIVGKSPTPVLEQWTNGNMALFPGWYLLPLVTVHALVISFAQRWLHQKDIPSKC